MTTVADLKGTDVLVLGLGVTGRAVARVLARAGARVLASDGGGVPGAADDLRADGVEVETGGHDAASARLDRFAAVVASPGISPARGFFAEVIARGVPVVAELDLAQSLTGAPVLAVTGTNGKTTVCRLAERIADAAGLRVRSCGNTEIPFIAAAAESPDSDLFVVEASSFALAFCRRFHPAVAVITNLAPDHLDWHRDLAEYRQAKARIAAQQTADDLYLYPSAQPELEQLAARADGPRRAAFGAPGDRSWAEGDEVVVDTGGSVVRAGGAGALTRRGPHFAADAAAAASAIVELGADASAITRGLAGFEPAPHRLDVVGSVDGVRVIDDAVATNPHATVAAIRAAGDRVVLIAGGRNKGLDLSPLGGEAARVKVLVALGEAAEELGGVFAGAGVPVKTVGSLEEAVSVALSEASSGDTVLFSPACASFDMFDNYAHRGRVFREVCDRLGVRP